MKLFSFYTGLHLLGDSLPSLRYFSRGDTLFFQGTGDPTLLHGDVPSRRAYSFLVARPERSPWPTAPLPVSKPFRPRLDLGRLRLLFPTRAHCLSDLWQYRPLLRHAARAHPASRSGRPCGHPWGRSRASGCCRAFLRRWWGQFQPRCSRRISTSDTHVIRALHDTRFYVLPYY